MMGIVRWIRIFFVLNSIVLVYSAEYGTFDIEEDKRAYDIKEIITTSRNGYKNSLRLKEYSPLSRFKFGGLDEGFDFHPSGSFLQKSYKCLGDVLYTFQNIKSQWALRLFDSFGKPGSGFLQGNFRWIGDYNECINVRASNPNSSTVGNFRGQYCSLEWSISFQNVEIPFPFATGICIPDSCSPEELQEDVLQLLHVAGTVPFLNDTKSFLNSTSLKCKPTERHLNSPAKAVIALLSIFFTLAVIGSSITAVQYFKDILHQFQNSPSLIPNTSQVNLINEAQNDIPIKENHGDVTTESKDEDVPADTTDGWLQQLKTFFVCFCIFTNGAKVLNTNVSEGELLCIHGIRFLSMSWVILGHTYMFGIQQLRNMFDLLRYVDGFLFQVVLQGFFSVDSFFVLSGFLLTYLSMKEFAKSKGSIPWPSFYIHRYIRLTPIYMMILAFSATVYLYMGSGPYWPDGDVDKNCKASWWKNLLYINNFNDQSDQCMGWAWYLANDMQFFVISPLFLITLWRWPRIGYALIAVFMSACWLSNFFITYHFELTAGMINITQETVASTSKFMDFFNKLYIKPYTRIGPYLIGMLTGYLLFKKKRSSNPKHDLIFLTIGWIAASAVTLTCVFGLYHSNPSVLANSFYNAFNRTGFGLGLSWVIYVCLLGQGGFINSILSYKLFIPLSRLTYAAYLIHPMVITGYFASSKTPVEFNHPTMVVLFLGFMLVTYGLSLPVALMLESPIVALEKLARKGFTKQQKVETVN